MELDLTKTAAIFVGIIAVGVVALIGAPEAMIPMETGTILMMVAPSMAVFGLICLAIGVAHGQYRAGATR